MKKDLLLEAATAWWNSKAREGVPHRPFTNMDHVANPCLNCKTPEEKALALAVAAEMQLYWNRGSGK